MKYPSGHQGLIEYKNLQMGLRCSPGILMICDLKNTHRPRGKFELKLNVTKTTDFLEYVSPI